MDGARFDSIARMLAGRLSRRTALRGTGAGVAAGLVSALKSQTGRAAVMRQDANLPYVVVRHYSPSASVSDLQQALGQYATQLAQQPGFIDYTVLSDDSGLTTVSIFDSQDDEAAAANQLGDWIDQNLASLLPDPDTDSSGTAIVHVASSSAACPTPPSGPTPTAAAATSTPASQPTAAAPTATAAAPTATALPVCTDPAVPASVVPAPPGRKIPAVTRHSSAAPLPAPLPAGRAHAPRPRSVAIRRGRPRLQCQTRHHAPASAAHVLRGSRAPATTVWSVARVRWVAAMFQADRGNAPRRTPAETAVTQARTPVIQAETPVIRRGLRIRNWDCWRWWHSRQGAGWQTSAGSFSTWTGCCMSCSRPVPGAARLAAASGGGRGSLPPPVKHNDC